jgi:hypothetical protein
MLKHRFLCNQGDIEMRKALFISLLDRHSDWKNRIDDDQSSIGSVDDVIKVDDYEWDFLPILGPHEFATESFSGDVLQALKSVGARNVKSGKGKKSDGTDSSDGSSSKISSTLPSVAADDANEGPFSVALQPVISEVHNSIRSLQPVILDAHNSIRLLHRPTTLPTTVHKESKSASDIRLLPRPAPRIIPKSTETQGFTGDSGWGGIIQKPRVLAEPKPIIEFQEDVRDIARPLPRSIPRVITNNPSTRIQNTSTEARGWSGDIGWSGIGTISPKSPLEKKDSDQPKERALYRTLPKAATPTLSTSPTTNTGQGWSGDAGWTGIIQKPQSPKQRRSLIRPSKLSQVANSTQIEGEDVQSRGEGMKNMLGKMQELINVLGQLEDIL